MNLKIAQQANADIAIQNDPFNNKIMSCIV